MRPIFSYSALVFGVLCLSTSAIFVRLAMAPSAITAFYRLLFTLLILLPAALLKPQMRQEISALSKKQWGMACFSGILLAIHYILWFESLHYTSVASSTVIVTLQPIFAILLAFFFLKERQSKLSILGCCVAIFGSVIIGYGDFQTSSQALAGDLMALLAAAVISLYFFLGQILRRDISATVYSVVSYGCSTAFLALYALAQGNPFFAYSWDTWKCFLALALVSTILGQFVFNLLLKWISAAAVSMGILGEPIGTCILAYLVLHEAMSPRQILGICVILGGLLLYFLAPSLRKRK